MAPIFRINSTLSVLSVLSVCFKFFLGNKIFFSVFSNRGGGSYIAKKKFGLSEPLRTLRHSAYCLWGKRVYMSECLSGLGRTGKH